MISESIIQDWDVFLKVEQDRSGWVNKRAACGYRQLYAPGSAGY
jgi:hypothetical protein